MSGDDCIIYAGMMIVNVVDDLAPCGSKKCSTSFSQRAVTLGEKFMPFHIELHDDFGKTEPEKLFGRTKASTTSIRCFYNQQY